MMTVSVLAPIGKSGGPIRALTILLFRVAVLHRITVLRFSCSGQSAHQALSAANACWTALSRLSDLSQVNDACDNDLRPPTRHSRE